MAIRPVFMPNVNSGPPVVVEQCEFVWNPGLAPSQKKKNIVALHEAARLKGIHPVLEVSSKSDIELGRRLSAFSLKVKIANESFGLEAVYQGSKKFELGGPHPSWFGFGPKEARDAAKDKGLGRLVGFVLEGESYPLFPPSAFYDWLYLRALFPHAEWIADNVKYAGFSDIEFNPKRSISCQARTMALFVWLEQRSLLRECVDDFSTLVDYLPQV